MKTINWLVLGVVALGALWVGSIFSQSQQISIQADEIIARLNVQSVSRSRTAKAQCQTAPLTGAKVALLQADIPLMPGAKRLTFEPGDAVSYRIAATSGQVADFYANEFKSDCWRNTSGSSNELSFSKDNGKLTIALTQDPYSGKTVAAYNFTPTVLAQVKGYKLAEGSVPPAPAEPLQPIQFQPPQDQLLQQPGQNPPPPPPPSAPNFQQPIQPQQPGGQPEQTCRINGVEMPGPCPNYNQDNQQQNQPSNQPGQPGQFGQPGQPGQMMGQQGPSEEQMQKMNEQRFKDMKKGLTQFSKQITNMKKSVTRLKTNIAKCGVSLPEELTNALAATDNLVAKIKASQTADELDEIVGDVEDVGSVMQDWGPRIGDLSRLCQMLKQGDRDMKILNSSLKRMQSRAKANKKVDVSNILIEYANNITAMKEILAQVKELAKTDPESALEKLQDEFYGQMDNIRNSEMAADMVFNITKGVNDAAREIRNTEKQLAALKKKKVDTSEADNLLAAIKNQMEEVKVFIKGVFDAEELMGRVETFFDSRQQLQDALQALGIGQRMVPQIGDTKAYNVQVNLPDAFKKQANEEGDSGNIDNGQIFGPGGNGQPGGGPGPGMGF